jgi:hypothetical protein
LPSIRNCSLEFLKDILCGKKKYFLRSQIKSINVPRFAELSTKRVLNLVKAHKDITVYLPELDDGRNSFIERDYLFDIINTCD